MTNPNVDKFLFLIDATCNRFHNINYDDLYSYLQPIYLKCISHLQDNFSFNQKVSYVRRKLTYGALNYSKHLKKLSNSHCYWEHEPVDQSNFNQVYEELVDITLFVIRGLKKRRFEMYNMEEMLQMFLQSKIYGYSQEFTARIFKRRTSNVRKVLNTIDDILIDYPDRKTLIL